jgi:hypothetical protein
MEAKGGRSAIWQRYEEATMRQRRPADPTDPGDAADLSIMGYSWTAGEASSCRAALFNNSTVAQVV